MIIKNNHLIKNKWYKEAKFTYSPLGKAFQKNAIQNQGQVKAIKKYDYEDDSPLISEAKEIFNELVKKRLNKITKLDQKVNRDDLI